MNFKEFQTEQKLRGGYYTPIDLAAFLARWVSHINPNRILEPSCGDGGFFGPISQFSPSAEVVGFELDTIEAQKAQDALNATCLSSSKVNNLDFLGWAEDSIKRGNERFDAILGNPPFVRYQYLPPEFQARAEAIFKELSCKFTKHTNAWVPFVLATFSMLRPGGRLAMVVPSEIIHVTHAQSLREYLGRNARRVVVVDPEELWFPGTLQGAVLLMVEKKDHEGQRGEGLGIYPVKGRDFLHLDPDDVFNAPKTINGKTLHGKWTSALLSSSTRSLLDGLVENKAVVRFDDVADVNVGIVTGANKFFLVSDETVDKFGLQEWAYPMFGRSEHCPGIIYDQAQHEANARKGNPTNFLWFKDETVEQSLKGKRYIEYGESESLHTRFKCRIRKPWYSVPSVSATEIGMLKRSHDTPRLILNHLRAYTTDTSYRITIKEGTAEQMVYGFVNALTSLSAELEGRHYGGGVLELVPSEIEKLLIPSPTQVMPDVVQLDYDVRTMPMQAVVEKQTKAVLGGIGVSQSDQVDLLVAWHRMRDRRHRISSET